FCGERDAEELAEDLVARGIAAAPVLSAARLVNNPQLRERDFFESVTNEVVGTHSFPTLPLLRAAGKARYHRAAPQLGEHNDEVLRDLLALSGEEIERLRADGIIGDRPAGL